MSQVWPPLPPPVRPVGAEALGAAETMIGSACGERLRRDVPLGPLTTFRLGGSAKLFLNAESRADLVALGEAVAATGVPLLVLGRGSNLLVADGGWPGVVLQLGARFRRLRVDGGELEAGAAAPLPKVASRTATASLGGLAFAVAIPGSVGGGVRMNAGAHGGELGDRLVWAEVVRLPVDAPPITGDWPASVPTGGDADPAVWAELLPVGEPVRLKTDRLGLGYRRSALPPGAVVTAARFRLEPAPERQVRDDIAAARRWRKENQPVNQPNCGSVFANPPQMAAGKVVELLGMKGERQGGAQVSEVHANFIVARDGARAGDVLALIRRAMVRARDELGVELRTEVQLVGDFETELQVEGEG